MTNLEELEIYGYSIEPGIIENLVSLKKLALFKALFAKTDSSL